jgi:hypothetical protein
MKIEVMQQLLESEFNKGYKKGVRDAQRTWVGLTDADWKEIEDMPDAFDQGVAWCLARLKKKNT